MLEKSLRPQLRPANLDISAASKAAPQNIAEQNATEQVRISLDAPMLLGTFGKEGDLRALMRLPGGKVRQISKGEDVAGGTVVAIADAMLVLKTGGRTRRLTMPN